MRVSELIEMLKDQPPDAEVELAVLAMLIAFPSLVLAPLHWLTR